MAFNRQAHPSLGHQTARAASDSTANLTRADKPARGLNAFANAILNPKPRDLAVLDDVHTITIRTSGIAPSHRIMADSPAAMLCQTALDRKARIVGVQEGVALFDVLGAHQIGICAIQDHRVPTAGKRIPLRIRMDKVQDPTLTDHRIVI